MTLLTNKLIITPNIAAIEAAFKVIKITSDQDNLNGLSLLNCPRQTFKAESVYHTGRRVVYVLYKKEACHLPTIKKTLETENESITITLVDLSKALACPNDPLNGMPLHALSQLFFNQLRDGELTYHNFLGGLYCDHAEWASRDKKSIWMLKLSLNYKSELSLQVQTFSTLKALGGARKKDEAATRALFPKKTRYCLDEETYQYRRVRKGEVLPLDRIYIQKALSGKKHHTIPFARFNDYDGFTTSKIGLFKGFLTDVNHQLGKYLSVALSEATASKELSLPIGFGSDKKPAWEKLEKKTLLLVDAVNTKDSNLFLAGLQDQISQYAPKLCVKRAKQPEPDCYTIRIVHNKDYYEKEGLKDPYTEVFKGCIIQHVTMEDFHFEKGKGVGACVEKSIQELLIKGDLLAGTFSLVDWMDFGYKEPLHVTYRQLRCLDEKTGELHYDYPCMRILPDGTFSFTYLTGEDAEEIAHYYESYKSKGSFIERQVEGILYQDILEPCIISKTHRFTVPNLFALSEMLKRANPRKRIEKNVLRKYLHTFQKKEERFEPQVTKMLAAIDADAEPLSMTYKAICDLLNMRTLFGQTFTDYLETLDGTLLHPRLGRKDIREELFYSALSLKLFTETEDGITQLFYYVGPPAQAVKQSIATACNVRAVDVLNPDDLEAYLPLMAVSFVRNGQATVLPFPFKYLREWHALAQRLEAEKHLEEPETI